MAFTVTARVQVTPNTTSTTSPLVTGTFTPSANSLLVAVGPGGSYQNATTTTRTVSGGGLTYTATSAPADNACPPWENGYDGWRVLSKLWTAPVGGSPSSMSCSFATQSVGISRSAVVADITGHDTTSPVVQSNHSAATIDPPSDSRTQTVTLGSAPTVGNLLLVWATAGADDGGGFSQPYAGSGNTFTAVYNQNGNWYQTYLGYRVVQSGDSSTITIADIGNTVGNVVLGVVEIAAASGATIYQASGTTASTTSTSGNATRVPRTFQASGTVATTTTAAGDATRVAVTHQASGTVAATTATSGSAVRTSQVTGNVASTTATSGDATRVPQTLQASGTAASTTATSGDAPALHAVSGTVAVTTAASGDATVPAQTFQVSGTIAATTQASAHALVVPPRPYVLEQTDSFDYTAGDLTAQAGWDASGGLDSPKTDGAGNVVPATAVPANSDNIAVWTGAPSASDYAVEVDVFLPSNLLEFQSFDATVRASVDTYASRYVLDLWHDVYGDFYLDIWVQDTDGNWGNVASGGATPFTLALDEVHRLRLEVNGFTFTGFLDGVQMLQGTDTSDRLPTGKPAVYIYRSLPPYTEGYDQLGVVQEIRYFRSLLVSGSVNSTTALSGDATRAAVTHQVSGTTAVTTAATGDVLSQGDATGTVAVSTGVSGAVTLLAKASGTAPSLATVSGDAARLPQTKQASGTCAVATAASGSATAAYVTSGSVPATTATTGDATRVPRLLDASGTVQVATTATGSVTVFNPGVTYQVSGTASSTTGATGAASRLAPVSGAVSSSTSSTLNQPALIAAVAGAIQSTTAAAGIVVPRFFPRGEVTVTSAVIGSAAAILQATGTVSATTRATGDGRSSGDYVRLIWDLNSAQWPESSERWPLLWRTRNPGAFTPRTILVTVGGSIYEKQTPTSDEVSAARSVYLGGHRVILRYLSDEHIELENAGYQFVRTDEEPT